MNIGIYFEKKILLIYFQCTKYNLYKKHSEPCKPLSKKRSTLSSKSNGEKKHRSRSQATEPGVPGVPWHPQILIDQLILSQPGRGAGGGADYTHHITTAPRIFRPFYGPEATEQGELLFTQPPSPYLF